MIFEYKTKLLEANHGWRIKQQLIDIALDGS